MLTSIAKLEIDSTTIISQVRQSVLDVLEIFKEVPSDFRKKPDGSPVTTVDELVQSHLKVSLKEIVSRAAFLGEEGTETPSVKQVMESQITWIVDPIDGTPNFLNQQPESALAICLATGDPQGLLPMLGWVALPRLGEMYYTENKQIRRYDILTGRIALAEPLIAEFEFSPLAIGDSFFKAYDVDPAFGGGIRMQGCTIKDILDTALGRVSGTLTHTRLWDFAASLPFALSTGCSMFELSGHEVKSFLPNHFSGNSQDPWKTRQPLLICRPEMKAKILSTLTERRPGTES